MKKDIYVLEVLRYLTQKNGRNGWLAKRGNLQHIGYMKAKFEEKHHAVSYYNKHNPHMRCLNMNGDYRSDYDPCTKLLYIVRKDYLINSNIDCFSINDNPEILPTENGNIKIIWKLLK